MIAFHGVNSCLFRTTKIIFFKAVVRSVILLFFLCFHKESYGKDTASKKIDTTYFSSLSHMLSVYIYGYSRFSQIQFVNNENAIPIKYKPNENLDLGMGFSYRWVGLSAAFNFKFVNHDDKLYGHSQNLDLETEIITRKTFWTGGFQSFKGFYWENVNQYINGWNIKDSVPVRPDILTFSLFINGIYVLNHDKFSFKAAYSNSEWQHHTAGSWLFGGYLAAYGVTSDSNLIPHQLDNSYPVFDSVQTIGVFTIGGAAGYTKTWVIHDHFFINATLFFGISIQASQAVSMYQRELYNEVSLAPKTHLQLAIGYNSKKYYYGLSFISDSFLTKHKNSSELKYNYGMVRLYYGRRFAFSSKKKN